MPHRRKFHDHQGPPPRGGGGGWGCCDFWGRCACRDVRPRAAFVVVGPTTTLFCRGWTNHDIPTTQDRLARALASAGRRSICEAPRGSLAVAREGAAGSAGRTESTSACWTSPFLGSITVFGRVRNAGPGSGGDESCPSYPAAPT